jgi:hypothetical protein
MLIHLGFNLPFVNWVMNCVTMLSFAVLINGLVPDFFRTSHDLRIRCPLSPLIFLLVAKGLSRALLGASKSGAFQGIRVGNSLYLSHLSFVDDILMFWDGSRKDALKLKEI